MGTDQIVSVPERPGQGEEHRDDERGPGEARSAAPLGRKGRKAQCRREGHEQGQRARHQPGRELARSEKISERPHFCGSSDGGG